MKTISKIFKITFLLALVVCSCISFTACKIKEEADCIPEKMGKAEGLYVYYNNYRSLTDGTEKETLLNEITVDGATYLEDEFKIYSVQYMTEKKEIFYSIKTHKENEETRYFLWHYNYDTKDSGLLYEFNNDFYLSVSETYIFAKESNLSGILFDGNLNIVEQELNGDYVLFKNLLYSYANKEFLWWKDGQFYSVKTQTAINYFSNVFVTKNYAYLFLSQDVYLIDINTGEYKVHHFTDGDYYLEHNRYNLDFENSQAVYYFLTYSNLSEEVAVANETGCKLWSVKGLEIEYLYTFDEKYEVSFDPSNEKYINLTLFYYKEETIFSKGETRYSDGYYDVEKKKFVKNRQQTIPTYPKERFVVGEYEFYVDSVPYGGILTDNRCYYLHRVHNGEDEILQYHFVNNSTKNEPNPVEFDDIHVK